MVMAGGEEREEGEVRALTDSCGEVCPEGRRWMGMKTPPPCPPGDVTLWEEEEEAQGVMMR